MKNRKIDKAIGDKIIQLHLQGKNTVEIEKIYSIVYKNEFHVCAEDKKDKFEM